MPIFISEKRMRTSHWSLGLVLCVPFSVLTHEEHPVHTKHRSIDSQSISSSFIHSFRECCSRCRVGYNSVVDHRSRRPVLSLMRNCVNRCHVWPYWTPRFKHGEVWWWPIDTQMVTVKGHSVQKLQRTDRQIDGANCITRLANAVGNKNFSGQEQKNMKQVYCWSLHRKAKT